MKHKGHDVSLFMMDTTIEISVSLIDNGVIMRAPPRIVDSLGDEQFYCNTCQETMQITTDWEFV